MHTPTDELHRNWRALKKLRVIDVVIILVKLIDWFIRCVFDVTSLNVHDRDNETWVVEEVPLGEISPPPRRVRKYLRGINREALTVGNRGEMMLTPLMGRVSRRSVCRLMFDWQWYSNGQDIQSGIDVDPFTLLANFVLSEVMDNTYLLYCVCSWLFNSFARARNFATDGIAGSPVFARMSFDSFPPVG